MSKYIVLILSLGLAQSAFSQGRFSADSYLSAPEKYLGKNVTVYVDSVDVPAVNCTTSDTFRVFRINTKGRNGNDYLWGGSIYVKIPKEDSEAFVRRHNNPNKQVAANLSAPFKEWPTNYDRALGSNPTQEDLWFSRCYSYSHFYLDLTK